MNAEQLQIIKDRVEKATPGPWVIEESRFGSFNAASVDDNYDLPACLMTRDNAEFVTNSREDIPALIAEVERLKALADFEVRCTIKVNQENARLREALEYYADKKHYEEYFFDKDTCDVTEDEGYIARQALEVAK